MAWKKIIVSGSQASLNSVAVDSSVSAGSVISSGDISGSNLKLTGNATIDGNIVLGGSINLGDNANDNIIIGGEISSSILPDADGTYDLGADAKRWRNVYGDTIYGDGSNLTNITVSQAATVASSFTSQTSVAVTHNFDSKNVAVTVYNGSDQLILPASVTLTSDNVATVTFDSSTSGRIVVSKGGHIVSGSVSAASIDGLDDRIKTKLNTEDVISGSVVQVKTQLGLENVTNESKATMFTNPAFSGTPTAPTPSSLDNSTKVATTAYVKGLVNAISTDFDDISNKPTGLVSASVLSSPSQGTIRLATNGVNTDVDSGLQIGDSPTFSSLILTGDLTVQGTTTSIETANLLVEDKFILLNSGSANPDQGGIIIDEGSGTGHAFVYNNSAARFGFTSSLASNATTVTPDAFASAVIDIDAGHTDIAEYQKNGNIKTDSGVVYIYS
jgi:hypothetical protein